jgi:divalent metal cation (Fe/Co/Zn/Cd) transporter
MNTPAEARRIEQRSLRFGVGANAVMALAGFSAHVLTGSSALLLDGLYSAVLVGSSLIASRISCNVVRPPDRAWPYGYEGQEALYVLFRSLVLLGVIGFGVGSACSTLIDWWRGSSIAALHLEPVGALHRFDDSALRPAGLAAPPRLAPHGAGVAAAAHRGPQCPD